MSDTIVDMPKVTQMLDSGWVVQILRCDMGSYFASAKHDNPRLVREANRKVLKLITDEEMASIVAADQEEDTIFTDDFTPEQALTRLAYKVHGEII